jgi:CubicO group peptidase (beta-lactamase class C family)
MPDQLASRIRSAAARALERYHVPGLAIAVLHGQDVVFHEAYGHVDIESKEPMDGRRQHCIASVTKTMVGLCAMALIDESKLSLDANVPALLPDVRFDGPAETMTLWHLLTHTAGIGEAQTPEMLGETVNPDTDARRKPGDFASMYKKGIVIEYVPGTKWHYANHGFNLLGEIISRAEDGADLHDVLQRRIFGPLAMHDSNLLGRDDPRLTTPYHRPPNEDTREQLTRAGIPIKDEVTVDGHNVRGKFGGEFNRAALASGGVQSTLPDMAKYAAALLRHADGIVRRDTFDAMIAAQYCPDARFTNWGLSFQRTPFHGRTLVGHGGAYFGGWNSHVDISLDDGVAIVQHMNMMHPEPADIFDMVRRAVFDVRCPSSRPQPPARMSSSRPRGCMNSLPVA